VQPVRVGLELAPVQAQPAAAAAIEHVAHHQQDAVGEVAVPREALICSTGAAIAWVTYRPMLLMLLVSG
jgi:hypothetical protein